MTNSEMSVPTMSLRDWFAGQALTATIARIPLSKIGNGSPLLPQLATDTEAAGAEIRNAAARLAYKYADSMLAARTPPPPPDDALRVAARALIAKIDRVQASPEYIAAWVCVATHQPYKGEQWGNELDALRAALAGGKE